jgi:hypothetical protein
MIWARMLAYVTGMVNQELLLRNEYLAAENRILRGQIKGRLLLSEGEKATLAEIAHHEERNHQGKENLILFPLQREGARDRKTAVRCRERLGGLLKYYEREAA